MSNKKTKTKKVVAFFFQGRCLARWSEDKVTAIKTHTLTKLLNDKISYKFEKGSQFMFLESIDPHKNNRRVKLYHVRDSSNEPTFTKDDFDHLRTNQLSICIEIRLKRKREGFTIPTWLEDINPDTNSPEDKEPSPVEHKQTEPVIDKQTEPVDDKQTEQVKQDKQKEQVEEQTEQIKQDKQTEQVEEQTEQVEQDKQTVQVEEQTEQVEQDKQTEQLVDVIAKETKDAPVEYETLLKLCEEDTSLQNTFKRYLNVKRVLLNNVENYPEQKVDYPAFAKNKKQKKNYRKEIKQKAERYELDQVRHHPLHVCCCFCDNCL